MAVTDKAWDGSAGRFSDEEYQRSCVLDRKSCGGDWAGKPVKDRCSLPIKEPNGDLNRAAVHAAAGRIGQVTDACPAAVASAKAALRSAYKELGEDAPSSIDPSDADEGKTKKDTDDKKKSGEDDFENWGVREGVPRHGEVALRAADDGGWELRSADGSAEGVLGVLTGHFAVFNRWTEISNFFEGRFMERMAPGAFTKTFQENRKGMRVLLNHGRDPSVGMKPLGSIRELDQDDTGARYDVDLLDTTYNRDIVPGLKAGQYGASFRFQVLREEVNTKPARSDHNPEGIEERTITEARVREFGPVTFPAYEDATAGIRSLNVEFFDLDIGLRSLDATSAARFIHHLRTGGKSNGDGGRENGSPTDAGTAGRTQAAPPPRAPERTTIPLSGRGRTTLLPGAARTLPPSRQPLGRKEPPWKI